MQKIGDITNTADPQGEFTDGNVAQGVAPTILPATMFNTWQREMINVVEGAEIKLEPKNDSQLLAAIKKLITAGSASYQSIYPIGIVAWFAQNKDPNTLFPGTTWTYIGENKTIRLGKKDGTDIMTIGGADSVTLAVGNLPAHGHTFSANTSSFDYGTKNSSSTDLGTKTTSGFDYGTKTTNTTGNHTHGLKSWYGAKGFSTGGGDSIPTRGNPGDSSLIDAAGNHAHTVVIGAHSHTVGIGAHAHTVGIGAHMHSVSGTTGNTGSGAAISVTNPFIKLMGWYRSA